MLPPSVHPATAYVGRFAPSPSGPLHLGSLVCALASYLDARANNGQWLVRMEDIDPPREQAGADTLILQSLARHGMESDQPVLYQSQRHKAYQAVLSELDKRKLSYRCNCTRARLKPLSGVYDQHCLRHPPTPNTPSAIRLNQTTALASIQQTLSQAASFNDGVLGPQFLPLQAGDDFVIHRKDGLFAYQLAVVVDDIAQKITHVVRGADLLDTTAKQRLLFYALNSQPPHYSHIPLVIDTNGNKLSKQNHAPAIDSNHATGNLAQACFLLNLASAADKLNLESSSVNDILIWAQKRWALTRIPTQPVAS